VQPTVVASQEAKETEETKQSQHSSTRQSTQREAAEREAQQARRFVNGVVEDLMRLRRLQEKGRLTAVQASAARRELKLALMQARHHSESAIKLDNHNVTAWVQKVRALYYLDEYDQAGSTLNQALSLFPRNPDLQRLRKKIGSRLR
jgi:tetratricopeptide (TPR) repeat protein